MMFEFPIDLLIKQNLRSVVYDSTNMGIMSSKAQHFHAKSNSNLANALTKEAAFCNLLKSPETIKWLFERPNEYMHKIFDNETSKATLKTAKDESETQVMKHRILYNFIKELREYRPPQAVEWIAFHHYMYFIYRNFLSPTPSPNNETLPHILVKMMYEVVISLTYEDRTQFYVRVITLLREFVMTARDNYDSLSNNGDGSTYLKCLLSYYSAFCSAANKISVVLSEFDQFMNERFNINWHCLHQRMFFQYFFMVATVQSKVALFNKIMEENLPKNRDIVLAYRGFIDDMTALDRHWEIQRKRIASSCGTSIRDESQVLQKNWKMFEEITKIMKTNFWIIRTTEQWKLTQEHQQFEGHFLSIVEDTWHVADRLIAVEGNCICEDCMTAEFRQGIFANVVKQPLSANDRLIMCYICREILILDLLGTHFATDHADLSIPRADMTKSYKWQSTNPSMKKGAPSKRASMKLCKVLSETVVKGKDGKLYSRFRVNENTFKIKCDSNDLNKESISKRVLECPVRNSEPIVKIVNENSKKSDRSDEAAFNITRDTLNDLAGEHAMADKEPIMKIASEAPVFTTNNFTDEITETCRAALQELVNSTHDDGEWILSDDKEDMCEGAEGTDEEKLENSTLSCGKLSPINSKPIDSLCTSYICGHTCKKDEAHGSIKKSLEMCEHQRELKKCDCAYCEVFGTSITTHTHKSSETRDRLRTRLHQRKEQINETLRSKTRNGDYSGKHDIGSKIIFNSNIPSEMQTNLLLGTSSERSTIGTSTFENVKGVDKVKGAAEIPKVLNDLPDLSDIDGLLDFIQGNKPIDKVAIAQKKAAKKARQKMKKEQERLKKEAEEEAKRKEEERIKEEKRKEEEMKKAQELAKQQAAQLRKNKKQQNKSAKVAAQQKNVNESKPKVKVSKKSQTTSMDSHLMEETIPAMVTIKRVVENNNSPPTVTITLKGSTPDQDKLLYTLVNGHASNTTVNRENKVQNNNNASNNNNVKKTKSREVQNSKLTETNAESKKKKKKPTGGATNISNGHIPSVVTTKELKVTLAVDKSFRKSKEAPVVKKEKPIIQNKTKINNSSVRQNEDNRRPYYKPEPSKDVEIDIPSLKLPPGITITKVNGPVKCKSNSSSTNNGPAPYSNVPPASKSGVIVVDTEKLIQQSITANANKKNKKKKNKKQNDNQTDSTSTATKSDAKPAMVTLKNPIFHTLQTKLVEKSDVPVMPYNEQASITKGENGMVTIRRPRCVPIPMEKEQPPSSRGFLAEVKPPVFVPNGSEYESKPHLPPVGERITNGKYVSPIPVENGYSNSLYSNPCSSNGYYNEGSGNYTTPNTTYDSSRAGLSAHDILWGLPGIEITKVSKSTANNDFENRKCQTADVSIIPTGNSSTNGADKFNFDRDDWPYESVFDPKDILEDDLDADERELEAFKRFCQQSIPPKHKEKVAHLNVKDIVLKKKNDVTYS